MKIVEGLKKIKANREKVKDLQQKIAGHCANYSHEVPVYGADAKAKISEWLQSIADTNQESVKLLCAIQKTNLQTPVTITLGGNDVTKTIAEWVWRRREYAVIDLQAWQLLTDRNLKEGHYTASTGQSTPVTVTRHYEPVKRDEMQAMYRSEPHLINATLEIVNAVTDLVEF